MIDSYVVLASIVYTNYPLNNPEYAGGPLGEEYLGPPRFPSVYEFLDENWKIQLEYKVYELLLDEATGESGPGEIAASSESTVSLVETSQKNYRSVTINIDNSITPAVVVGGVVVKPAKRFAIVTIEGTYSDIFDQKRFDFRLNDESLLEDADTVKIGDNYYAPYNYVPDRRVFLENMFSIQGNWKVGSTTGTFAESYNQTVLNNWDANRRRLINFRDNPKRGEQIERNQFAVSSNSPDETVVDPNVPNPTTTLR
jgi:hypothetical protein